MRRRSSPRGGGSTHSGGFIRRGHFGVFVRRRGLPLNVAVAAALLAAVSAAAGYGVTGWLVGATVVLPAARFLVGLGDWRCPRCHEEFGRALFVDRSRSCGSTMMRLRRPPLNDSLQLTWRRLAPHRQHDSNPAATQLS